MTSALLFVFVRKSVYKYYVVTCLLEYKINKYSGTPISGFLETEALKSMIQYPDVFLSGHRIMHYTMLGYMDYFYIRNALICGHSISGHSRTELSISGHLISGLFDIRKLSLSHKPYSGNRGTTVINLIN